MTEARIPGCFIAEPWLPLNTLKLLGWLSPEEANKLRQEIECLKESDSTSSQPQSTS